MTPRTNSVVVRFSTIVSIAIDLSVVESIGDQLTHLIGEKASSYILSIAATICGTVKKDKSAEGDKRQSASLTCRADIHSCWRYVALSRPMRDSRSRHLHCDLHGVDCGDEERYRYRPHQ